MMQGQHFLKATLRYYFIVKVQLKFWFWLTVFTTHDIWWHQESRIKIFLPSEISFFFLFQLRAEGWRWWRAARLNCPAGSSQPLGRRKVPSLSSGSTTSPSLPSTRNYHNLESDRKNNNEGPATWHYGDQLRPAGFIIQPGLLARWGHYYTLENIIS